MKASKISLMAALIAGVLLAYSPALRAEDAKEGKDAKKHEGRPGRDGAGMKERLDKLAEDLKFKASREEMTKKMKGILTTEQFEKWEKNRPQGGPGGFGGQGHAPRKVGDDKK